MDKQERIDQLNAELERLQEEVKEEITSKLVGKIIRVDETRWNRITFYHVNSVDEDSVITTAIYYDTIDDEISFDTYEYEVSIEHLLNGAEVTLDDIETELMQASKRRVGMSLRSYQEEWD